MSSRLAVTLTRAELEASSRCLKVSIDLARSAVGDAPVRADVDALERALAKVLQAIAILERRRATARAATAKPPTAKPGDRRTDFPLAV